MVGESAYRMVKKTKKGDLLVSCGNESNYL